MAPARSDSQPRPRYQPSQQELDRYAQLLAKLTPSPSAFEAYRSTVDNYLSMIAPVLNAREPGIPLYRLRRSELFEGRQYLVAYVEDAWLNEHAPGCDAIASVMAERWEVPPLVFLPDSKRRARSAEFRAVLEHEFVHVNQAILGTFPRWPDGKNAADLLAYLMEHTAAEYEACYLEMVRWPATFPTEYGVSLEQWCLLRGYTQALERILFAISELEADPAEVTLLLTTLATSLPERLRAIGAIAEAADWFGPRVDLHLGTAMSQVLKRSQKSRESPTFRAAGKWLRARILPSE